MERYGDVLTTAALETIEALVPFDRTRAELNRARTARRAARASTGTPIGFLDPAAIIPRTTIKVADAREGRFDGSEIPPALERQWIQGTGPAARPGAPVERSLRNVAYALLSGADGWMFDGEDALGQVSTMSLDNQRNLALALARAPVFLEVAAGVAGEMNAWSIAALGRPIVDDWAAQLDHTVPLFRARGLHLDDRHVRWADGAGFSASIVDAAIYVANNLREPRRAAAGRSCCTCPRFRRRKTPRCGTTSCRPSSTTSAPARARSRSTCWSSSSRRATS